MSHLSPSSPVSVLFIMFLILMSAPISYGHVFNETQLDWSSASRSGLMKSVSLTKGDAGLLHPLANYPILGAYLLCIDCYSLFNNRFYVYIFNGDDSVDVFNVTVALLLPSDVKLLEGDHIFHVDSIKTGESVKVGYVFLVAKKPGYYRIKFNVSCFDASGNHYILYPENREYIDSPETTINIIIMYFLAEISLVIIPIIIYFPRISNFFKKKV